MSKSTSTVTAQPSVADGQRPTGNGQRLAVNGQRPTVSGRTMEAAAAAAAGPMRGPVAAAPSARAWRGRRWVFALPVPRTETQPNIGT
jgi:hypothetical protein